ERLELGEVLRDLVDPGVLVEEQEQRRPFVALPVGLRLGRRGPKRAGRRSGGRGGSQPERLPPGHGAGAAPPLPLRNHVRSSSARRGLRLIRQELKLL